MQEHIKEIELYPCPITESFAQMCIKTTGHIVVNPFPSKDTKDAATPSMTQSLKLIICTSFNFSTRK